MELHKVIYKVSTDKDVRRVLIRLINENYSNPIERSAICRNVFESTSITTIAKGIQKAMGIPPNEWTTDTTDPWAIRICNLIDLEKRGIDPSFEDIADI
jgi:hypothetical protein